MMYVAHRRIKDGGAGREIYGDNCNCWSKREAWGRRTVIHLVPPRIWKRKSSYDLLQVRLGLLHSIGLT
jgi:hypothetical protein